ncbi:MAG: hypothetical protein ACRCX8_08770 [Sarcina sp.]
MIQVKKGIEVGELIDLLKPFSDMEVTFTKANEYEMMKFDCYCDINLTNRADDCIKLEIKLD